MDGGGGRSDTGGRVIDITLGIEAGMLVWPDDPPVTVEPAARISRGDPANVSALALGTHTGTHVDPPAHFLEGGATVDRLSLDVLVGPATVVDLRGIPGPLQPADLDARAIPSSVRRLLLKTDNSAVWSGNPVRMPDHYVSLSLAGARWLADRGIRLVGADFLSIEPPSEDGYPVHRALLEAGIVLVEGLDLSHVVAGEYVLACLPLKVIGGDGAPARCVLMQPPPPDPARQARAGEARRGPGRARVRLGSGGDEGHPLTESQPLG